MPLMQAIIPKNLFDPAKIDMAIENALETSAANIYAQFAQSHAGWKTPVTFTIKRKPWQREIKTTSKIYRFVNFGTRPHWITARRKKSLAFGTPFSPKTTPNSLVSGGGSRGSSMVFRKRVWHPGTEARNFDVVIIQEWGSGGRFRDTVQKSIDEAAGI